MRRIETIVFDGSGVLFNDLYTVWKAESEAYESCGLGEIESIDKFRESFRLPIHEYHKAMGVPEDVMPRLEEEFRRAYPKYSSLIKIFPEVKKALNQLRQARIRLAVASNIPSLFLAEHLQRFGIDGYFDAVTGQDDCSKQKPSPAPILVTLEKLGSKPERSAYVGDMEEDIIAGKKAQVYTFAVTREEGYHPDWRLKRQEPNFLISDLNELVAIVERLNRCTSEE